MLSEKIEEFLFRKPNLFIITTTPCNKQPWEKKINFNWLCWQTSSLDIGLMVFNQGQSISCCLNCIRGSAWVHDQKLIINSNEDEISYTYIDDNIKTFQVAQGETRVVKLLTDMSRLQRIRRCAQSTRASRFISVNNPWL